ncbi:hypothetical protein ACQKD2_13245, partial [Stenotrophomonas sp. NPDC077426]
APRCCFTSAPTARCTGPRAKAATAPRSVANEIARDVSETLRKLKAAQFTAANPNQVCPAKWKEGEKTLTPSLDLVGKI